MCAIRKALPLALIIVLCGCALVPDEADPLAAAESAPRTTSKREVISATGHIAESLSPSSITQKIRKVSGFEPNEEQARQLFREAESEFRAAVNARKQNDDQSQRRFAAAANKYLAAAKRWPDSSLEEDAFFWAAEGLYFADRYPKASKSYNELVKKYPTTRHMDTVATRQFALAEYWLQLNNRDPSWVLTPNFTDDRRPRFDTFGNAVRVFDRIRFDDPTGRLSDDATMAAANANFTKQKYHRADALYADLRDSFPDSEHQFNAHLLGLKCKLLVYEGPEYDGTALDEAEELVKRMFRLFPDQSVPHREYLERAIRQVRLKKAEREWVMAKYYDRRKEYGAARYYYELVRRDYSDTTLANEARNRLAQIGGFPDDPPQHLAWLASLFPTAEQAKPLIARDNAGVQRR